MISRRLDLDAVDSCVAAQRWRLTIMADGSTSESQILAAYRARTPRAAELNREALTLLPSGIVHDSRRTWPYSIYGDRASGSHKWDVDGNEYIDYYGGHGSLILG